MIYQSIDGWNVKYNDKTNVAEIRKDKFTEVTGGQVLVTVAYYRSLKVARDRHKRYLKEKKSTYGVGIWEEKNEDEWKKNRLIITYGQNGTTEWDLGEMIDLNGVINKCFLTVQAHGLYTTDTYHSVEK
jgi:hypothetical protein